MFFYYYGTFLSVTVNEYLPLGLTLVEEKINCFEFTIAPTTISHLISHFSSNLISQLISQLISSLNLSLISSLVSSDMSNLISHPSIHLYLHIFYHNVPQKAALADWKKVIKFGWWWWLLPVWCGQEQLKSLSSPKWHSKITRMIQNNSLSSQTKFNQNQIKNTEVKKIRYETALVGLLGRPKNSCSHSKLILCYSLPNDTPYNKFQPNWMDWIDVTLISKTLAQFFHVIGFYSFATI